MTWARAYGAPHFSHSPYVKNMGKTFHSFVWGFFQTIQSLKKMLNDGKKNGKLGG